MLRSYKCSRRFDVDRDDLRARLGGGEAVEVQPFDVDGDRFGSGSFGNYLTTNASMSTL
jgi:hypothetical protein